MSERMLLSGDEAVAFAALDAGISLGTGYPGTPSTEILETFSVISKKQPAFSGRIQWSPNEKVALEVGIGAAFAGAAALVTMKHVGVNVAADPLFTVAYTGVQGALILVSADDPGMASSQNEQDNRRYALAAGVPMIEPSDSQESYDLFREAIRLSHEFQTPVLFRMTTRVCHSKSSVSRGAPSEPLKASFVRDIKSRVMIPAYARPAHKRLRERLAQIAAKSETSSLNVWHKGNSDLGIIASGVAYLHAKEAAPEASFLKLGITYPLPLKLIKEFSQSVKRCVVIEEGDPYLAESLRAAGIQVESRPEAFRFGELNVQLVRQILAGKTAPEVPASAPGKPPQLCVGCPYHAVYETLKEMDCIVAGDIGCYTLGVLPPYTALDTCVCMGASLGVGLGLRHVLPEEQARRVVSVIGDSTFVHTGINGLMEMVYNPPKTGHVLIILDNSTTAMTGQQEHPGTGRALDHEPAGKVVIEELIRAAGIKNVEVLDATKTTRETFRQKLTQRLAGNEIAALIWRRPCLLAAGKIKEYEKAAQAKKECEHAA